MFPLLHPAKQRNYKFFQLINIFTYISCPNQNVLFSLESMTL